MKKQIRLSILAAAGILLAQTASAADATRIGFINDPRLAQESTALQGLQMQRDKLLASLKVDVEKEAMEIISQKRELQEQEQNLSKAELGEKLDAIDKAERNLQERAQKAAAELQKNYIEAALSFKDKAINPVVKELAKEKDFNAIINAGNAFYIDEDLDVTEEAIKRMNKKMPKIEMKKVKLDEAAKTTGKSKKSKK